MLVPSNLAQRCGLKLPPHRWGVIVSINHGQHVMAQTGSLGGRSSIPRWPADHSLAALRIATADNRDKRWRMCKIVANFTRCSIIITPVVMVFAGAGFEPATNGGKVRGSTRLSYPIGLMQRNRTFNSWFWSHNPTNGIKMLNDRNTDAAELHCTAWCWTHQHNVIWQEGYCERCANHLKFVINKYKILLFIK